jgi:hypothetical protein
VAWLQERADPTDLIYARRQPHGRGILAKDSAEAETLVRQGRSAH